MGTDNRSSSRWTSGPLAASLIVALAACGDASAPPPPAAGEQMGSNTGIYSTAVAANGIASPADRSAPPAGGMQQLQVVDSTGFGRPVVASLIQAPAGWRARGGINWQAANPQCGPIAPHYRWMASAPDGLSAVEILPEEKWGGSSLMGPAGGGSQNGCPNLMITTGQQFMMAFAQRYRPGAQISGFRPRPDIARQIDQAMQKAQPSPGMDSRQWAEAGEVMLTYQINGQPVDEVMIQAVMFSSFRMQSPMGGVMQTDQQFTAPAFAVRAPKGQLDLAAVEAMRTSVRTTPEYKALLADYYAKRGAAMNRHNAIISSQNMAGARARSAIIAQTGAEIGQMQMDGWTSRQASSDRMQRETLEGIGGYETYADPRGGSVQLDNSYDRAFQMNDGSHIQTNDPYFNPGGTELQRQD